MKDDFTETAEQSAQTKPWYQSRGVWGSLVTIGASVAGAVGIALSPEHQEIIVSSAVAISTGLGGILALIGRLRAKKEIK